MIFINKNIHITIQNNTLYSTRTMYDDDKVWLVVNEYQRFVDTSNARCKQ